MTNTETRLEGALRLAMIEARQRCGSNAMIFLPAFASLALNEGALLQTAVKVAEGHGNGWAVDINRAIAFRKYV